MNAYEALVEFTKTAQLKDFRNAMKSLESYNMVTLDKSDEPCGSCIFYSPRLNKVKNLFPEELLAPSHCFLSNLFTLAYKRKSVNHKLDSDYIISCFGSERENWIEPPNSDVRYKLASVRNDVFDSLFDVATVFTEMTKFIAAIDATMDSINEEVEK